MGFAGALGRLGFGCFGLAVGLSSMQNETVCAYSARSCRSNTCIKILIMYMNLKSN